MATLRLHERDGGGIFFVDFRCQGKRYRTSTMTSDRKLAELFLKDIEVQIAKGKFGFGDLTKKEVTLKEFIEKLLKFSKATKAENTFLLDRYSLESFLKFIGNVQLRTITNEKIEEYKVHRLTVVKPTTINLEIRQMKAAFELSVKWGYIPQNPFKGIKQLKIKNSNFPKFLGKEEVRALLDSIPECDFKNLVNFYLYTGCRREEALNLRWEDIDMGEGKVIFRVTKSGLSRRVPFNGELSRILASMVKTGEKPFEFKGSFVTHKFKKYLRASGIDLNGSLRLHSLRHTYASHLAMAGVDLLTISKLLGHSSVKVTEMYAHLVPDHLKASVERLKY
jgi:integrase